MVIFLTVAILMIAAAVSDRLSLLLFYKFSSLGRETFQITAVHRPDLMTAASHLPKTCLVTKTHFLDGLDGLLKVPNQDYRHFDEKPRIQILFKCSIV